ncbi:MAG: hypothetical protein DDT32_02181 [Syntrophomonadaceae bacterium]|nr:hypothetical protein [Bacillota bacterium]
MARDSMVMLTGSGETFTESTVNELVESLVIVTGIKKVSPNCTSMDDGKLTVISGII